MVTQIILQRFNANKMMSCRKSLFSLVSTTDNSQTEVQCYFSCVDPL